MTKQTYEEWFAHVLWIDPTSGSPTSAFWKDEYHSGNLPITAVANNYSQAVNFEEIVNLHFGDDLQ